MGLDDTIDRLRGAPLPATGFAMGDMVIGIILREAGLLPEFELTPAQVLVTMFNETLWLESYKLSPKLRDAVIEEIRRII